MNAAKSDPKPGGKKHKLSDRQLAELKKSSPTGKRIQVHLVVIRIWQGIGLPQVWSSNLLPYGAEIYAEVWIHMQNSDQTCQKAESCIHSHTLSTS